MSWLTLFLGFHILGTYVHSDAVHAFGSADKGLLIRPILALIVKTLASAKSAKGFGWLASLYMIVSFDAFASTGSTLLGWFREYLWQNSGNLVNSTELSVLAWSFLLLFNSLAGDHMLSLFIKQTLTVLLAILVLRKLLDE